MPSQQTTLVTGASRGLGRTISMTLAEAGFTVIVTDVAADEANDVAAKINAQGGRAHALQLDVRDAAQVRAAFADAAAAFGPLTLLVNNAGVFAPARLIDIEEAVWDQIIDTNLKGALLCSQAFARQRIAAGGGGAIVNIASTAAFSARPGAGAYSASKAALAMLTKSMAMEFGPHNIRVNALAPGLIDIADKRVDPQHKRAFLPMVPLGRLGSPEDVARAVAFLASDAAAFITGTVLPIDGGFLTGRTIAQSDRN